VTNGVVTCTSDGCSEGRFYAKDKQCIGQFLLANRTAARCIIGYWHNTVVSPSVRRSVRPSVRLSVCLSFYEVVHYDYTIHPTTKVYKQAYRMPSLWEHDFITFSPLYRPCPLKFPSWTVYIGAIWKYSETYCEQRHFRNFHVSGIAMVNMRYGYSRRRRTIGSFRATAVVVVSDAKTERNYVHKLMCISLFAFGVNSVCRIGLFPTFVLPVKFYVQSVWIHWYKQPNYDFRISQGSVATVLRWDEQNYSHLYQVSS